MPQLCLSICNITGVLSTKAPPDFGNVNVYGALIGDTISVSGVYTPNTTYTGSYTVAACNDTPTIELRPAPLLQQDRAKIASRRFQPPSAATGSLPPSTTLRTGSTLLSTSTGHRHPLLPYR